MTETGGAFTLEGHQETGAGAGGAAEHTEYTIKTPAATTVTDTITASTGIDATAAVTLATINDNVRHTC